MVIIVVAIAVGLSTMSEKKQVVVQMRILQLALSEAGSRTGYSLIFTRCARHCCCWWKYCCRCCCRCCVDCCEVKSRGGTHTVHPNVGFSDWREKPDASGSNWEEVERRNTIRLYLIYILSMNHYFRQTILLGMFPVTVSNLLLFQGSDPLNALLNGVAVVFLIDLDDVIGEVVFTAHYREKASSRMKHAIEKLPPDMLYHQLKFDQAAGLFVCVVTAFIVVFLFEYYDKDSSHACVTSVFNSMIDAVTQFFVFFALETLIRHEYFFAKFGYQKQESEVDVTRLSEQETFHISASRSITHMARRSNIRTFSALFRRRFRGACGRLVGLAVELSLALGVAYSLLLLALYWHNGDTAMDYVEATFYTTGPSSKC